MALSYFEDKLFNKIAFASSSSILESIYANCLIRAFNSFMCVDNDISLCIWSLNNCNFKKNFALTTFAPNTLFNSSHISAEDFCKSIRCSCESESDSPRIDLALSSLFSHSFNYLASVGALSVPFTILHRFLLIICS